MWRRSHRQLRWRGTRAKRSCPLRIKHEKNSHYESLRVSDYFPSSSASILTMLLVGCIRISAAALRNSLRMLWRKSRQGLCYLCRPATESPRLRRLRSRLGIWVEIRIMSLSPVLTPVRSLWASAVRCVSSFVSRHIKPPLKPVWTPIANLLKHGLPALVVDSLLLVLAAGLLVRVLTY